MSGILNQNTILLLFCKKIRVRILQYQASASDPLGVEALRLGEGSAGALVLKQAVDLG